MRTRIFVAATLLTLLGARPAQAAAILYTTTDLGDGGHPLTNTDGSVYGLTGIGGAVYAFDKSPVTRINQQSYLDDGSSSHLTLQDGTNKVGYIEGYTRTSSEAVALLYPTFTSIGMGWFTQPGGVSPVNDINSRGQVVGLSQYTPGQLSTYAAFSDPTGLSHGFGSTANNLNDYIDPIPGVTLTSAFRIDDLGRIIAAGSNGDDYLLTPIALGSASPVPEPSSAMMLSLVGSLLGLRSIRRRWRS